MGSFKTFKDILEEAKIKEEMDSLTPSSSEDVTIFEKNKGAKSFKDPAPKTTLASPVEAEKLRADIYEAKQAADKDAFRAKQAADYEAKIAKEEAKKAKEVAKEANARLKAEQALEKATVSNAKKAQTLNLKNIDIADDIKTTEDALSKALSKGRNDFPPGIIDQLTDLAKKAPNHPFVKKYLELAKKAPLKLAPYADDLLKTAAPYVKPIVNVASKTLPVVGLATTAVDILDPETTATDEQELASMNQGQRELAEGRNPFKASSPGRPATALERMDVIGLKQSVDPSSYPVNDSKNTSSINDIDSIIKSDLNSDFSQNYNKKLKALTPEEKILFDKESSYLNKNVPAKEQMEAQTKILDKVISNRSQFLQKELNEYVKNIQNSNLPEERKQQLIQEKINEFNKNQLPFNTESSSSGDSLIASGSPVAVIDKSKTQPSISSVSKQKIKTAPKLASEAAPKLENGVVDKNVQKQQSLSQYYQNLMDQYNQIQKFSQDKRLAGYLGEAGEDLAYALARAKKPESSFYKDFAKSGEKDIEQFKEKSEFEKNARMEDPNSEESISAREFLRSQGITNISDTASAAFINKNYPQLSASKDRAEERKFQKEQLNLRFAEIAARRDETRSDKEDRFTQSLRKEVTSGALAKLFANYNTANRMSSAIKEFKKDPNGYKDYATLMGGLKTLQSDESVVREAEIRLGMSAADLATKIRNWGNQLISGEKLSPKQRQQIVDTIDILKETSRRQYLDAIQPVLLHAESSNIDKKFLVNQGFLANEDVIPQKNPNYHGQTVIQNGKTFKWNEDKQRYDKI